MKILDLLKRRSPQDRFAEKMMQAIRASGWPTPISYERASFTIDLGDDNQLYLGNFFRDAPTPQRQDEAIQAALAMISDVLDVSSYEAVAADLLPLIRNRAQVQVLDQDGAEPQLSQTLAGPLSVLIAIDRPNGIQIVTEDMARDWNRGFDELLAVATQNLRARSDAPFERSGSGFFIARYKDHYDTSRLLLTDVLAALPLEGKPVAVAVSRTTLVVTGSEDILGLNALAEFVDDAASEDTRATAYAPLVLEDGAWRPFAPRTYGLGPIRLLWVKQSLFDYSVQADSLQTRPAVTENRIFVAPLEAVIEEPDIHTWTSWHEGGRAWLPKADAIGLTRKDGVRIMRAWADVEAVCGAFQVLPDAWPERHLAQTWPSDDQWAELSARTTPAWFPA